MAIGTAKEAQALHHYTFAYICHVVPQIYAMSLNIYATSIIFIELGWSENYSYKGSYSSEKYINWKLKNNNFPHYYIIALLKTGTIVFLNFLLLDSTMYLSVPHIL